MLGSKKATPAEVARERREQGHTVHVMTYDPGMKLSSGALPEFADLIEEVESAGWHLDHIYQGPGRQVLVFRV